MQRALWGVALLAILPLAMWDCGGKSPTNPTTPDDSTYLGYGNWSGLRRPSAREVRMLVELWKLPLGAHVNPDGSWLVR
jgi:hypothetical protein